MSFEIPVWREGLSPEQERDIAYAERNLLALHYADGWYYHGEWEGWGRVLTLDGGRLTFHIPDDFPIGNLPEIGANWDGHTTEEKWQRVLNLRRIRRSK